MPTDILTSSPTLRIKIEFAQMAFCAKSISGYYLSPHTLTPVLDRKTIKKGFLKYAKRSQFVGARGRTPTTDFSKVGNEAIYPIMYLPALPIKPTFPNVLLLGRYHLFHKTIARADKLKGDK